jgi:hypothetical protein
MLEHVKALLAQAVVKPELFRESRVNATALSVDDLYSTEERVILATGCENPKASLVAIVTDAQTQQEIHRAVIDGAGASPQAVDCGRLAQGTYRVRVSADTGGTVTDVFVVMQP